MTFILRLNPISGALLAAVLSLAVTMGLFVAAHMVFRGKRPEKTPTFVQQMALRVGTMHALVVALVFSILTGELIKQYNLSDVEALSAANIYYILGESDAEPANRLRALIPEYLKTVIEKDWAVFSQRPYELPAWKLIAQMQRITLLVYTEFGRRVAENASAGADHGTGCVAYALGGGVNGGRIVSDWPGLAVPDLETGEDLKITTDLRTVLAELLTKRLGGTDINTVFPGFSGPTSANLFL